MKSALRPALPLLIGIALAGVLALLAMHSLAFGASTVTLGSHHSAGYVVVSGVAAVGASDDAGHAHEDDHAHASDATHEHASAATQGVATHEHASAATQDAATHGHGASVACTSADSECCSSVANASGAPSITLHAFPGATVSALPASVPTASLLATEAAERPPSRALLSVIRV